MGWAGILTGILSTLAETCWSVEGGPLPVCCVGRPGLPPSKGKLLCSLGERIRRDRDWSQFMSAISAAWQGCCSRRDQRGPHAAFAFRNQEQVTESRRRGIQ
ncbi:unnamed protein product, partial [Nesidiocoris tenuis]